MFVLGRKNIISRDEINKLEMVPFEVGRKRAMHPRSDTPTPDLPEWAKIGIKVKQYTPRQLERINALIEKINNGS